MIILHIQSPWGWIINLTCSFNMTATYHSVLLFIFSSVFILFSWFYTYCQLFITYLYLLFIIIFHLCFFVNKMISCAAPVLTPLPPSPCPFRHEQPWSAGAGGEGLQDALRSRLPGLASWTDAAVLEAGARWKAHFWVPSVLPGGLLHCHGAAVPARRKPVTSRV